MRPPGIADRLEDLRPGLRAGIPFGLAALVLGVSFGVLARPLMGTVAPIVMSAIVFPGAGQFGRPPCWPPAATPRPPSRPARC